jgi:flavin-dependent dehydrogenase
MKIGIIGGGVCGLYLAWKLAEKGEDITVFEQKKEIGKQSCSGLFSQRIFAHIPQSKKLIQNEIDYTLIHFPKKSVKVSFSDTFFVMNHFELDKLVARYAENAGAKIILNRRIDSLPVGFDRIIGCDGAKSFTRKILKLRQPNFRLAIQGFVDKQDNSNFVETWAVKDGFIWKIPRGEEIEYGIMSNKQQARKIFQQFLFKNNLKLDKISASLVSQGPSEPHNGVITLCGEAIAGTKPWSGGGVIWGLKTCALLIKHFPDFFAYEKAVKRFFAPEIFFSKLFTKIVYFSGFNIPWILPKKAKIEGDWLLM